MLCRVGAPGVSCLECRQRWGLSGVHRGDLARSAWISQGDPYLTSGLSLQQPVPYEADH